MTSITQSDKCCCSCHKSAYIALDKVDKEFTFITTKDGTKITKYSTDQLTTLALNGFVDDVESDLLAYWGFLITTKKGNESMGNLTLVEFNEQYPNSKWDMDLQEFQNLVTITTVGNTTNISEYKKEWEHTCIDEYKSGDIVLVKNMNYRLQNNGVCPDQLEEYNDTLSCEKCDKVGSFFLIDEKDELGLCYKCLLEAYPATNQVVDMNEEQIVDYYGQRETQCYDLWCHKGHLRNMDKNSSYQERNGEVCNYTHPYQNPHDEMVGYYRIMDGLRYDYVKNTDDEKNQTTYREVRWNEDGSSDHWSISFEDFSGMIEDEIIHHEKYVYPTKQVKFSYTAEVPDEENVIEMAWDLFSNLMNEEKHSEIFTVEVLK